MLVSLALDDMGVFSTQHSKEPTRDKLYSMKDIRKETCLPVDNLKLVSIGYNRRDSCATFYYINSHSSTSRSEKDVSLAPILAPILASVSRLKKLQKNQETLYTSIKLSDLKTFYKEQLLGQLAKLEQHIRRPRDFPPVSMANTRDEIAAAPQRCRQKVFQRKP